MASLQFASPRQPLSPRDRQARQALQTVCMALVLAIVVLAARLLNT